MKSNRQNRILEIIRERSISTQDALIQALRKEGFHVTQATVSRDIKELGLVKTAVGNGKYQYAVSNAAIHTEQHINLFSEAIIKIASALHTIVIHTYPGMAPAVAAALDSRISDDILGSVAGDDTILLICENEKTAQLLRRKLCNMLKRKKEK